MRALLIGMGSIAQKHLDALWRIEPDCEVFALRSGHSDRNNPKVQNLYSWDDVRPGIDFVMICNPTSEHFEAIEKSANLGVPLFIEKPPLMDLKGAKELVRILREQKISTYTAFLFRFHPVIQWLRQNLKGKRVLEIQAYCGSYLPEWRPNRDYREVYSAKAELGGGVHLDLIHELDYLIFLFGKPDDIMAYRSKVSQLEINSTDVAHYWMQYQSYNASVILNYYRRDAKRSLEIVMNEGTWTADLINSRIINSNGDVLFENDKPLSETFFHQMDYFLKGLKSKEPYMNSLEDSIKTLEYCLAH